MSLTIVSCCACIGVVLAAQDVPASRGDARDVVELVQRELVQRELAPSEAAERVRWIGASADGGAPLEIALVAMEDGLGDAEARARFESALARALAQLSPGGRLVVAPQSAPPTGLPLEVLYLDVGRIARRCGELGLAFERELPLRTCAGRRAAWVFARGAPLAALDPDALLGLSDAVAGRRLALLAEAPSRAAALRALHLRGVAEGVEEWLLDERWALDEAPLAASEPRTSFRRVRSGTAADGLPPGELDGVLALDGLFAAREPAALLASIHAALREGGDLWILERCAPGPATALERVARRGVEPRELFRDLVAAGFAVRAIEERSGILSVHAARAARAPARARGPSIDAWAPRWKSLGLGELGAAHVVGEHPLVRAADLQALGLRDLGATALAGPNAPVPLLIVAGWSRHPDPALFLDRPAAHLVAGGWLALVHDLQESGPTRYADPDAITALQPELRFVAELPGASIGWPDAALWLFRRP